MVPAAGACAITTPAGTVLPEGTVAPLSEADPIPTWVSSRCACLNESPTMDGIANLAICSGMVLAGPALMNTSASAPVLTTQVAPGSPPGVAGTQPRGAG